MARSHRIESADLQDTRAEVSFDLTVLDAFTTFSLINTGVMNRGSPRWIRVTRAPA
jgi:hypothetical protein